MTTVSVTRPAWAEIDLSAITHNLKEMRRVTDNKAKIMAIVKANAYGHGAVEVSRAVLAGGADYLGVAILDEALELKRAGINAPILILGSTPPEQAVEAVEADITLTVYNQEVARVISAAATTLKKNAKIHIKIDTGMGRLGFLINSRAALEIKEISSLPGLEVEGIFTHFAASDIIDKEYSRRQFEKFILIDARLKQLGLNIPIRHISNSAAIIDLPQFHCDMVRLGIALYGLYPSGEVLKEKVNLRPALSFKARVANIKTVPAGTSISYGRTYITDKESKIATIPVGYADGYTRLLSNNAHVLIKGVRVPVIGRICMDQFMVDVSTIPEVEIGDEVILIGKQGEQEITADELAELLGTINYEIVCMVGHRVPRIYKGG